MATASLVLELKAKAEKAIKDVNRLKSNLNNLSEKAGKADKSMLSMANASDVLATGVISVAVASSAAVATIISMSRAAADYSREIQIAAQLSGVAAEKIQLMAHATATVGIGLEQLGDISKDTLEKIGDYLNTGGGGFQDFADAMKLSKKEAKALANEFKDLSGPEVLQRMVDMMEDANVSAVQMSHALEGMASDTTKLIPLLANSGEKMKTLSDNMRGVIVPLSDEDIEKFIKMGEASDLAIASLTSLGQQVLVDLSESFIDAAEKAAHFYASLNEGTSAANTTEMANIVDEIKSIEVAIENSGTFLGRLKNGFHEVGINAETGAEKIDLLRQRYEELQQAEQELTFGIGADGKVIADDDSESSDSSNEDVVDPLINPEANAAAIELLEDRFKTEEELLIQKYEREREIAAEHKDLLLELEEEFINNLIDLDEKADEKKRADEEKKLKEQQKIDDKKDKEKKKLDKVEDKVNKEKADKEKKMINDGLALAMMAFGDKKEVAATVAFINTAEGVTKALASQDYAGAVVTAATGAAQISKILSSDAKSGGSGSVTAPSAPTRGSRSIDDIGDTSSLDFTDSTDTGSQTIRFEFANDSGDDILDAIANGLIKKQKEN